MTDSERFRVVVGLADESTHTFHNLPGDEAARCVSYFTSRDGDGLRFMPNDASGMVFYPWDQVLSCAVEREVSV